MTDQLPQKSLTVPIPANETERLAALHRYKILDTPPETAFDRITTLAARLFNLPIVLISLVDESRAWFKSCIGFADSEVPRDATLCSFAVLTDEPLIIPDTRLDDRFACNPFVQAEPGVRFYAGAPLLSHDGFNLGTLCLLDTQPHEPLTAEQQATLVDLAAMVVDELDLRLAAHKIAQVDAALLEITQGVATVTGGAFFDALVQHLAKVLDTDYVYIGLIEGDHPKLLRTIATLAHGQIGDNLTYPLQDTPCWEVIGQRKTCCYPRHVQAHFPNAPLLKPLSVESYIAVPFCDSNGTPLGILGIMDGEPLENVHLAESLLTIFAARIATELERQQAEAALRESEERYRAFVVHSSEGIWRFELEEPLSITIDEHSQIEHLYQHAYLAECNQVMVQMYGFSSIEEIIGTRLGELMPSSDPRNLDYLRAFIRSGYRLSNAESYEVDRFGNPKYFANNLVGIIQDHYLIRAWGNQRDISDRKLAETALRESEAQFRQLANTVPQLIWTAQPDGGIDYLNERWLDYTGIPPQVFYEWGWQQIVHPDDLPHTLEIWTAALQTGELVDFKHRFRYVTGEWRWQLVRGLPFKNEMGQIVKWFGTCTDIHESEMREQDARFLSDLGEVIRTSDHADELITTTAEMIAQYLQVKRCCFAEIDETRDRWWVNSDYHSSLPSIVGEYRVLDYPPVILESLRSGHLYITNDSQSDPRTVDYYAAAYKPMGLRAHIVVPFYSDGRWAVNLITATDEPRQWQPREINLLETAAERIWLAVEKLRSDVALKGSEERYRALIELSPQLVFMSRPDGFITYCNQWGLEFTGRSLAELQGYGWAEFIHPEHRERIYHVWQTAIREISDYEIEIPYRRADGVYRWLYTRALPVTDETGTIIYWLGVGLDTSDRKQAELQLQQQASELKQLNVALEKTASKLNERNQELDRFVYTVSHDLKAPLRAISNLSQWIEDDLEGQLDEDNQRQMQLLRQRVARMEDLINGLLAYSRIGRTEVTTEKVDVGVLLSEIHDSLMPPSTFTIFVQPEMPTFMVKRLLLSQVFSNLISNAIKHHDRPDGRVEIRASQKGEYYEFSVADDGRGIAPEHHERVFGIFQTLKGSDMPESTGIGLSIVKKIIETEGGSIVLESNLSEGATFRFTWLIQPLSV